MTVFASDNVTSACPEIMQAINNANKGHVDSYGNDQWSKNLDKKFSKGDKMIIIINVVSKKTTRTG